MVKETAVERVVRMELLFDAVYAAYASGANVYDDARLSEAARELERYMDGGQWLEDYLLDERGGLAQGLKRGVLSQDGLYNLLGDISQRRKTSMRKNFGAKPYCYPQPVFILAAYGEDGVPCAMNAAWGGVSEANELSMCISPEHKTTKNILARGAFTVSMATAAQVVACDYVGVASGNDVADKFARAGFHAVQSEFVDAPMIQELPMAIECRLKRYDEESCRLVGEIVNVCAEESVLGENGRIDVKKLDPITFDPVNGAYLRLGEVVGKAFSDGKRLL